MIMCLQDVDNCNYEDWSQRCFFSRTVITLNCCCVRQLISEYLPAVSLLPPLETQELRPKVRVKKKILSESVTMACGGIGNQEDHALLENKHGGVVDLFWAVCNHCNI